MEGANLGRDTRRGLLAGLLTLFLGPPLGGITYGLIALVQSAFLIATGQLDSPHGAFNEAPMLLLLPVVAAAASFLIAWTPVAVAAAYVTARVRITGEMSWAETAILAVASLPFSPTFRSAFSTGDWKSITIFLACSLSSALVLRYLAGRTGRSTPRGKS